MSLSLRKLKKEKKTKQARLFTDENFFNLKPRFAKRQI